MNKLIYRYYDSKMSDSITSGKVFIIYGPRRVGKTTLIKKFLSGFSGKYYFGTGDDKLLRDVFESESTQKIKGAFSGYNLVVIDEAQRISNIGLGLKILIDQFPDLKVIASGSSSFELSNKVGEPLTGRQKIITLYPLSFLELKEEYGPMHSMEMLENFLIYGMYPETITSDNTKDKIEYITSLKNSYLFKDILELEDIRNSDKLLDLLKLISFQIGREVSLNELSTSLGLAKQTIERYLDLLEKAFVIKKVHGFSSGNLRKEITKTCRYYFLDNGIRNAVINNFNTINLRDDIGMLWENFLFSERLKKQSYHKIYSNIYFWRTYDRKEIDLVEERDGELYGYEFKWGNKKVKEPVLWKQTYSNAQYEVITKDNYLDFIC